MEEIASAIGMSKRTIYARYVDKSAIFKAAVHRATERYTVPKSALDTIATSNLEQTLKAVAHLRIANVSTPNAIKLQRILSVQSYRFPELLFTAFEEGTGPTVTYLSELFVRYSKTGEIEVSEPREAAIAFLSLAVGGLARIIVSGASPNRVEIERRVNFAVGLFLNGVRKRR